MSLAKKLPLGEFPEADYNVLGFGEDYVIPLKPEFDESQNLLTNVGYVNEMFKSDFEPFLESSRLSTKDSFELGFHFAFVFENVKLTF